MIVRNGSLSAGVVTTISVTATTHASVVAQDYLTNKEYHRWADKFAQVSVINVDGADDIFFTVDGTTPTVDGDDCVVVPAATGSSAVTNLGLVPDVTVKLISDGTPQYSVEVG